jgi:hypothetical protein
MAYLRCAFVFMVWIAIPLSVPAQEVKIIDMTAIQQRTELRHPPALPAECDDQSGCSGGGQGSATIVDGAPDVRDLRALAVYMERVRPTDINPAQPVEAEFKILNTGLAPIEIPVSPHLSDLQPGDESQPFEFSSIQLRVLASVSPGGDPGPAGYGHVELYGAVGHEGTTLMLKPGEWVRVKASFKFKRFPSEPTRAWLRAGFVLRKTTYSPQPGGGFSLIRNIYPNQTPTPSIPVSFSSVQ